MADANPAIHQLWRSYTKNHDQTTKDQILIHYLYLVKTIVYRMMPTYQDYNEYDDLVSCGVMGLMDAIDKFDIEQGVRFTTYAAMRIRGEILDHMRKGDWASSSLRRKINAINRTSESLEARLGKMPDEMDIAQEMGLKVGDVSEALEKSYIFNILHFEDMLTETWTSIPADDSSDENPSTYLEHKEMSGYLADLLDALPEKERIVIALYYYEEMTLKEIARVLGVSESRVSQIHSKVLLKLRSRMEAAASGE